MSLILQNDYLLLERAEDTSSDFASEEGNKYKVAYNSDHYEVGELVYVLQTAGEIKVDGKEYTVAEESQVVAHVA